MIPTDELADPASRTAWLHMLQATNQDELVASAKQVIETSGRHVFGFEGCLVSKSFVLVDLLEKFLEHATKTVQTDPKTSLTTVNLAALAELKQFWTVESYLVGPVLEFDPTPILDKWSTDKQTTTEEIISLFKPLFKTFLLPSSRLPGPRGTSAWMNSTDLFGEQPNASRHSWQRDLIFCQFGK